MKLGEELGAQGFALVYQGGHHSVYCDGETHATTDGGWTKIGPQTRERFPRYVCDCARYAKDTVLKP
jgi:hypothetical protein